MTALSKTAPSWLVSEHAPLDWLISLIFVDDFCDLLRITTSHFDFLNIGDINKAIKPARYKDFDEAYQAAADYVANDAEAKALRDKAIMAIESGELTYYQYPTNEWGDKLRVGRDDDMDSLGFLRWAGKQGYGVHEEVAAACEHLMRSEAYRIEAAEKETRSFPTITQEDFARLRKQPLWRVGTAILYLLGRRSRSDGKEHDYRGENEIYDKIAQYVEDANTANLLTLAIPDYVLPEVPKPKEAHKNQYTLDSKVKPEAIIAWAKTLPMELPILGSIPAPSAAHISPEMKLMLDALEHFWKGYDAGSKNAPLKKHVTAWLQEEGAKRGIALSDNLAEGMDSIMRPLNARRGGLKSNKG
ncbi:MAG: hypothetical protein J0M34_05300 [Alphaproteobacteria bacterium]|nr:hypothetical protein [Alphaproteobacteria bacterium]